MSDRAALVLVAVIAGAAVAQQPDPGSDAKTQPVRIIERWSGKPPDAALRKAEPAQGFILDQQAWAKLWRAWRGQEKLPVVDFQKQMVLVFTADGPNNVGCAPTHDGKGNVRGVAMSTMMAGPGFGYLMLCISREGVETVNGKPLPGVKIPPRKPEAKNPGELPGTAPGSPPQGSTSSPPASSGEPGKAQVPPIKECAKVTPKPSVFEASDSRKPLALHSQKEAAEHFDEQELAKLVKQVDFAQQFVLVFAWRGSGQDRLEQAVAESFPEQIVFSYKPGRTRDLRPHVHVYALRSNVKWSVK